MAVNLKTAFAVTVVCTAIISLIFLIILLVAVFVPLKSCPDGSYVKLPDDCHDSTGKPVAANTIFGQEYPLYWIPFMRKNP